MSTTQAIESAKAQFGEVLEQQLQRVERLKREGDWTDYALIEPITIGMIGGDGIGHPDPHTDVDIRRFRRAGEVLDGFP